MAPPPIVARRTWLHTAVSVFQAVLLSGVPTLLLTTGVVFLGLGMDPMAGDALSLGFIATVTLLDTAFVALLIRLFLTLNGETSNDVFVGPRQPLAEVLRGLWLVPASFLGVTAVVLAVRQFAPALHNVPDNPLAQLMSSPFDAGILLVVVVLGGGVKEELQRAFILHQFRHTRTGRAVTLVLFSLLFGALHYDQGWDVSIGVGLLGLFWGVLYYRRGSALMSMANHAGFNAVQVLSFVFLTSMRS
ncbi:MAG TPA: CPBP family intramembrane glutamic endopeptidase [Vicinamibacterales bacterium]|nr:CPBP family intramembrane glutamic endopeptidase [Vicinamibacterales bacterium]